jgi:hypothetical protein
MVSVRRVAPVLLIVDRRFTASARSEVVAAAARSPSRRRSLDGVQPSRSGDLSADARRRTRSSRATRSGQLAQQYYGNAYLWPQLWESNTWITDAHWIYPGDVLLVEGEGARGRRRRPAKKAARSPRSRRAAPARPPRARTRSTATQTDGGFAVARRRCRTIPSPSAPRPTSTATATSAIRTSRCRTTSVARRRRGEVPAARRRRPVGAAAPGDLVYISGGAATASSPARPTSPSSPKSWSSPATGDVLGRAYNYVGQIRILCTDTEPGLSRASSLRRAARSHIGARLKPMPQLPIPIARVPELPGVVRSAERPRAGYIVDSRAGISARRRRARADQPRLARIRCSRATSSPSIARARAADQPRRFSARSASSPRRRRPRRRKIVACALREMLVSVIGRRAVAEWPGALFC